MAKKKKKTVKALVNKKYPKMKGTKIKNKDKIKNN